MPLRHLNSQAPPGTMNKWITFFGPPIILQSGANAGTTGPAPALFSSWAAMFALAGEELDKAQQIAQKITHFVLVPYQLGVEEQMTFQYLDGSDTRTFQIIAIDDKDEQRWQLKIYCYEIGQNAGGAA